MCSMTSQGHTPAHLHRAIAAGNLLAARALAAELPRPVDLGEALGLLLVISEREPRTFPRAGARFVGRLALERPLVIADVEHAAVALLRLPSPVAYSILAACASAMASVLPARACRDSMVVRGSLV
jgi:hypothetical protein